MKSTTIGAMLMVSALVIAPWSAAFGADTTEGFDPGASNLEIYFAYSGSGKHADERGVGTETLVGFGISDRFSALLVLSGEANDAMGEGDAGFSLGLLATPIDTENFDLDVGFDVGIGSLGAGAPHFGHNTGELLLFPWIEINIDSSNDLSGVGWYVLAGEVITGEDRTWIDKDGIEQRSFKALYAAEIETGFYVTPAEGHQFFIAYSTVFNHDPDEDRRATEVGGVSLGYNFLLSDNLEAITEVAYDIAQDGEDPGFDFVVGLIATLPAGE